MVLELLMCLVLLSSISMSDDLLDGQQAALPLSGQMWHMASENVLPTKDCFSRLACTCCC
jgi:hypothetical protein